MTPGFSPELCANGLEGWFHLGGWGAVELPIQLISQDLSQDLAAEGGINAMSSPLVSLGFSVRSTCRLPAL